MSGGIPWDDVLPQLEGVSHAEVARRLDVSETSVRRARKRRPWLSERERAAHLPPEHDGSPIIHKAAPPRTGRTANWSAVPQDALPSGHYVKGVSTYVSRREDGSWQAKGQWIKTNEERESLLAALRRIGDELREKAPPPEMWRGGAGPESTLNLIAYGDPHFGAMSWPKETGQRWDLDTAETVHVETTRRLLERAPAAKRCLLVAMGDNLHVNSRKPLTPASGHLLDVDTRFPGMFDAGARTIRRGVDAAMQNHEQVDVVILSGNHDPDAAFCLAYALACYFHREPRVRVDLRVSKYRYYVFGRCLLGFVHGDTRKTQKLSGVMTNEWPDLVGRCAHRAWYTGHLHHELRHTLDDGATVTQVETLAARDAYAAEGAWATRRSVSCYVWDREAGHVGELHERIPHHRVERLAPLSDVDGWDEGEGLALVVENS